jgi:hypothetical protein
MSEFLHFSEHTLQELSLLFMGVVYALRLTWLLRFKAGRDRQAPTGPPGTTVSEGILYSWMNIAMPWAMESTRAKPLMYVQFAVFHLGVLAAIGLSFVIPYAPSLLESRVLVVAVQFFTGAAFLVGLLRIYRRVTQKVMRAISSPDDYFSLGLLTVWFASAFVAAPDRPGRSEAPLLAFFLMTAFFLLYVPFSKISHYLYYPFTRYYFGKTMGHRGVYPMRRSSMPEGVAGRAPVLQAAASSTVSQKGPS